MPRSFELQGPGSGTTPGYPPASGPTVSFMSERGQVIRFAVGTPAGPRARTWRLWVPRGKSDVYVSSRRVSNSVKVSLHQPGPSRFALTSEFVRGTGFQAPEGRDARLAFEWERPRPEYPDKLVRPFTIIVPWDEVLDRDYPETGSVTWTEPPPEGSCVHFDLVYWPTGIQFTGHPGARGMGTKLVGKVELQNGQGVFITSVVREMGAGLRAQVEKMRAGQLLDAEGNPIEKTGMLAFGTEPNPDADDGTFIGTLLDVTRPDEA